MVLSKFNPNVLPDKDDPNNYCRSCNKALANRGSYRVHLNFVHKMHLIIPRRKTGLSLTPGIRDPSFYCQVYNTTYISKGTYRKNIKQIYKVDLPLLQEHTKYNPNMKVDNNSPDNTRCTTCKLIFRREQGYNTHMKRHSQLGYKEPFRRSKIDQNIIPDLGDPNNHCKLCKKYLSTRTTYLHHLRNVHDLTKERRPAPKISFLI